MLHTILLVCCLNQFTVSVEKPLQSFTVQVEKPVAVDNSAYVVMFSAPWCGPCRNYKDSGKLDKIINSGIRVNIIDTDTNSTYYSGRIPRFWICRNSKRIHEFPEGAIDPDTIIRKVKEMDKPPDSKITNRSVYNGRPNNSHTNRESLIEHLMTGEVHRGKHSLTELNNASDVELDKLHNMDHTTR